VCDAVCVAVCVAVIPVCVQGYQSCIVLQCVVVFCRVLLLCIELFCNVLHCVAVFVAVCVAGIPECVAGLCGGRLASRSPVIYIYTHINM